MKNILFLLLIFLTVVTTCNAQDFFAGATIRGNDFNVRDFGAVPDGVTLNTKSIQKAIDSAASRGGGRVVFSAGRYVCGSIYLKSNVFLCLEKGATLLGSLNPLDYVKDSYCRWTSFIFAVKQNNIGIIGGGTIDCRGFEVANNMVQLIHQGVVNDPLKYDRPNEGNRPENIHFRECDSILIQGITLRNPASWNQQYDQCRHLLVENVTVDSKSYWNNDGIDVVDCSDVIVRNCYMDAADDVYCFKSHSVDGVSENVYVENCVGRSSANGIKFGTMTRGIFRHFRFKNITIFDTYRSAVTIASVDGGAVEDVEIDGLRSINTGNPIFLRFASRNTGKVEPCLKDIVIKNMYAEVPFDKADAGYSYEGPVEDLPRNVSPSSIVGVPGHRIENVRLENIEIVYPGKTDMKYAYQACTDEALSEIPEREKQYPEFSCWKELPAWGFYIRHADGIVMKNVRLRLVDNDYRPCIVADDANNLVMEDVDIEEPNAVGKNQVVQSKASANAVLPSSNSGNVEQPKPMGNDYNASMFGIKSDGVTLNTSSVQKAIDYIAEKGGGRLVFKVGRYLVGSIHLRSNVSILLDEGAILVASSNPLDYDAVDGKYALLIGEKIKNVTISGLGVIEGCDSSYFERLKTLIHCGVIPQTEITNPQLLYFKNCKQKEFSVANVRSGNDEPVGIVTI